ncbi:hypothetical protein FACS1894151_09200 [Spirochaetia bacterium]|nr:hypothetical protein FACS1894151_09200 [Spirochaetia bacterium]
MKRRIFFVLAILLPAGLLNPLVPVLVSAVEIVPDASKLYDNSSPYLVLKSMTYKLSETGTEKIQMELILENGNYYLRFPSHDSYIMGCMDENNIWYEWNRTEKTWKVSTYGSDFAKIINGVAVSPVMSGGSGENLAGEGLETRIEYPRISINSTALAKPSYASSLNGRKTVEYLPTMGNLPGSFKGCTGKMAIAVYRDSGTADFLVFDRPLGWFAGESDLFSKEKNLSYETKALTFLFHYFDNSGNGNNFLKCVQVYKGTAGISAARSLCNAFTMTKTEKNSLIPGFTRMLRETLMSNYREMINRKTVFGNRMPDSASAESIYGNRRNIYMDLYFLYNYMAEVPVFSSYVRSEGDSLYQPEYYRVLTPVQGKEVLQAALRYFTWGVEYSESGTVVWKPGWFDSRLNFKSVSGYLSDDKTVLVPWIDGVPLDETRRLNYYPGKMYVFNGMLQNQTLFADQKTFGDVLFNPGNTGGFTVPFVLSGSNSGQQGYPLPYAKNGIDSPRTFAYKMTRQLQGRMEYSNADYTTTRARIVIGSGNITNVFDAPYDESSFIPGGTRGLLSEAGVDGMGMLTGILSMLSDEIILTDRKGQSPQEELDGYFRMNSSGVGLGINGKPLWSNEEHPALWQDYRFAAEDLEKITVMVPDLSLIQEGDLLVRYDHELNETEIGIIAGFSGGVRPLYGGDQRSYFDNIQVITVNRRVGQVTLGTWGNGSGYGGFTEKPEACIVRRLLAFAGNNE